MALPPERVLRAILASAPVGIVFSDAAQCVQGWSLAAERLTGLSAEAVLGRPLAEFIPDGWPSLEDGTASAAVLRRSDGTTFPARVDHGPVIDERGNTIGTLAFLRESPGAGGNAQPQTRERALREALMALRKSHEDLKSTQIQLIHSARLESIGRLAAGVAHEVKNPLAILLTGTQLLKRRSTDSETLELLGDLEHAIKRANGVIIGLLDFAASTTLTLEAVGLEQVVDASVQLVHHEIQKHHVRLVRERVSDIPVLRLDRTKIEQILVNLMLNAVAVMPQGGILTARTGLRQLKESGHGVGFRKTDHLRIGQTVAFVEIEDTGTGIAADVLPRIFEPFFTTKSAGQGTGLGLAVCRMIANLHRGSVWLENRSEGGTRATLWLPAGESDKERVA